MVAIKETLRLIRVQNLLLVALTMVLMRYAIIKPILSILPVVIVGSDVAEGMSLQFPWYDFLVLVLSTVAITAAGYVINDYFDIRTDLANQRKVVVGTRIPRRRAMMWHNILNLAGIAGGFYVSYRIGYFWIGILFVLVSGLLYFYSATYKRQLLIGNIIVSFLTAMVPFMVVAFEIPPVYAYYSGITASMPSMTVIFYWVGAFMVFAFIISLAREIVKDIEDFEGDRAYGSNSLPVVIGIRGARTVAIVILAATLVLLYLVWYTRINDTITLIYITLTLAVPLGLAIFKIARASGREHYHAASTWIKISMLTGILYSLVVLFIIHRELAV